MLRRPSDYFSGKINHKGKAVSVVNGSYLGFLNIDQDRFWDGRYMTPFKIELDKETLDSDFLRRRDLLLLKEGRVAEAQVEK